MISLLFNSYQFIFIFLPITLIFYYGFAYFRHTKLAITSLIFASLAFYAYWDIRYLPLLVGSILFNFTIGSFIEKTKSKKLLIAGITVNLMLLGYFKYAGFFIKSANVLLGSTLFVPKIILPLGISFFTFTQAAYLVDAYRNETPKYSLLTYSLFVTLFPHLIAGPILYHKDMIPQFSLAKNFIFSSKNISLGIALFSMGLLKKVLIADNLAPWVKLIFEHANEVTFFEAWVGALGYTMQLYFDFSGYSEMAVGLGLMFNFNLPINFNSPYKSTSIIDFWRRWHITLSTFLKNYLYIPLGGNRRGYIGRMRNLMLTMLLGGLWHGAGWNYVIWGGLHGVYLVINHVWRKNNYILPGFLSWLLTFICIVIAWVFFRADSFTNALLLLKAMIGLQGIILPQTYATFLHKFNGFGIQFGSLHYLQGGIMQLGVVITLIGIVSVCKNPHQILSDFNPTKKWAFVVAVIIVIALVNLNNATEFLYFQF